MRLFEAILDANQRAVAGDTKAGLHPTDFEHELPIVALTCIDVRLNKLLPSALGVPEDKFIWLRNAGNIITGPVSSTMRSLALACAVKGGKEIVVIGHSDCQVCKSTVMKLTDAFRALGIERSKLPENIVEYFGMFASERQNVIKAVDIIRSSPIIGPKVAVHGLMIDIETGKLEWVVNGYQTFATGHAEIHAKLEMGGRTLMEGSIPMPEFHLGEMKFPELKIGETTLKVESTHAKPVEARMEEIGSPGAAAPQSVEKPAAQPERTHEHEHEHLRAAIISAARKFKIIGSDQKEYGPISGAKLIEWIADKRIDWRTPAQMEGTSGWQPLVAIVERLRRHNPPATPPAIKPKLPLPKIDRR